LGVALLGLAGCGSKGLYPVSGQLEDDTGQPLTGLAGYTVTFTSEALGQSVRGDIQPDGTFRLGTAKSYAGAAPGEYKVTVTQPHIRPERTGGGPPVVDLIYEDPVNTPLRATVEAKKDNFFSYKLKRIPTKRR
jgi:hypothetical protein